MDYFNLDEILNIFGFNRYRDQSRLVLGNYLNAVYNKIFFFNEI